MQAQNEHSPPTSRSSTMATFRPPFASRPAATSPAGPAPITTTSKLRMRATLASVQRLDPAAVALGVGEVGGVALGVLEAEEVAAHVLRALQRDVQQAAAGGAGRAIRGGARPVRRAGRSGGRRSAPPSGRSAAACPRP